MNSKPVLYTDEDIGYQNQKNHPNDLDEWGNKRREKKQDFKRNRRATRQLSNKQLKDDRY